MSLVGLLFLHESHELCLVIIGKYLFIYESLYSETFKGIVFNLQGDGLLFYFEYSLELSLMRLLVQLVLLLKMFRPPLFYVLEAKHLSNQMHVVALK